VNMIIMWKGSVEFWCLIEIFWAPSPPTTPNKIHHSGIMTDVFVYTGAGGDAVPQDVVRIRVDPSVTSIPARAFDIHRFGYVLNPIRPKLAEVELCEGLVEIGERSFASSHCTIMKINIPNTLRRVNDMAFESSLQTPILLHDDIESIGGGAFAGCIFNNFRVPPLITTIPISMLYNCRSMFSLELTKNVSEIQGWALACCHCLRNVAFPPNAIIGEENISDNDNLRDLHRLFGSKARIVRVLKHRFDGLPIHCIVYYQSYHQGVLQILIAAINTRSGQRRTLRSKLNPTGNQQDCLGMTPLHILACSLVHDLEVYRLIVEKYPANLITEDRWGALPLLYAFWGAAPAEVIEFLLEKYQSLYHGYEFNWTMMVETMGRCDTPKERIENLLCVKELHFPEQPIDWEYLLNEFGMSTKFCMRGEPFRDRMQFLVSCSMSTRVYALAFKVWRDHITDMIQTADFKRRGRDNPVIFREIQEKLAHFEGELPKLKEATTILELALWKARMNANNLQQGTHNPKKFKTDESSFRRQCRVTCGGDIVIRHMLRFLIST
jgi:hypothetical protein